MLREKNVARLIMFQFMFALSHGARREATPWLRDVSGGILNSVGNESLIPSKLETERHR